MITPSGVPQEGGYDPYNHVGKLVPPYKEPEGFYWAYDQSKEEWTLLESWYPVPEPVKESYPDNNPKTQFGMKKVPLDLVPPSVVHALAEAFSLGEKKYGPYNWREKRVSSSVYYSAALRHLGAWWDGEEEDPESGFDHLGHALACLGILVDAKSVGNLNDNRPPKGSAARLQQEWAKKHE